MPALVLPHPEFSKNVRVAPVAMPARQIWYPTRDSNPEEHVSETCAYRQFRQRGKTKSPGALRRTRALRKSRTKLVLAFSSCPGCARDGVGERARLRVERDAFR